METGTRKRLISFRMATFIAFFLCGVIPMLVTGSIIMNSYANRLIQSRMVSVQSEAQYIVNRLGSGNYMYESRRQIEDSGIDQTAEVYDCRIIVVNDDFRVVLDTAGLDEGKYMVSDAAMTCFNGNTYSDVDQDNSLMRIGQPIISQSSGDVIGCLLIRCDLNSYAELFDVMQYRFMMVCIISVLVMIPIAIALSAFFSKPLRTLISQIRNGDKKEIGHVFDMNDYKETAKITRLLNEVDKTARSEDEGRQRFVSDVSHELKTPIAAIRVLTSSLLEQEDVPNEVYHEFVTDISDEVERESDIIEDLLSVVRLEKSGSSLKVARVDMNEFLETLMKRLNPLAMDGGIELILETFRPVTAEIDAVKLSQALSNIIENAIKYNEENGYVRVTLNADHRFMYITVADNGMGIPDDAKKHVFERFYRAEQSRSRELGGSGLGLSITQSIVFQHNGDIKFDSTEGEGTTFTVRIPLIYIP